MAAVLDADRAAAEVAACAPQRALFAPATALDPFVRDYGCRNPDTILIQSGLNI